MEDVILVGPPNAGSVRALQNLVYGSAPEIEGASVLGQRVSLVFDRRNQEFTPSRGTYFLLWASSTRSRMTRRLAWPFASLGLRTHALHVRMLGMPIDVEIAPFVDVAHVFDDSPFDGDFNVNPRISMRVLNRPNIGLVVSWAHGDDGEQFTGGVSLASRVIAAPAAPDAPFLHCFRLAFGEPWPPRESQGSDVASHLTTRHVRLHRGSHPP